MSRKPELKGRAARLARLIPAGRARAARTPFVLLVVLLLGGGLIGLLVLNSALSEGAFKLDDLKRGTKSLTDEEQSLQRDIDAYAEPDALQRRARELGMVPGGDPAFLNPDGKVQGVPSPASRSWGEGAAYTPLILTPATPLSEPAAVPAAGSAPSPMSVTPAPGATPAVPQYAPPAQQSIPSAQSSTYPTPGR
ncbi:septum formation initiator family protein [Streptomyces sp. NPDC059010]|uniref:septum formation initiator family protein n=1 Tax=Streptomyces sp. NPDC059010 TaxID=3346695 RepID=UPI0036C3C64E